MSREIDSYPNSMKHEISDILGGVSRNRVVDSWRHKTSYWKDPEMLPNEAFANITSACIANPDGLQKLKEYLPKTMEVYDRMVSELLKRKG